MVEVRALGTKSSKHSYMGGSMRRIHALIPLTLILCSLVSAQDFRDVTWGDTKAEVRASETFDFLAEQGNATVFTGKVSGKEVGVVYQFLPDDRLFKAAYVFSEKYTNRNTYIRDYEEVSATLERLYGTPTLNETDWSNDLYQDDPQDYGMAVAVGHLAYRAEWETETTFIRHVLTGNNFEINHGVSYSSTELADAGQEQEQQEEDDAF